MPTTVLATALPHSLADDAPFQLTVFVTHKLIDGPAEATLADFPAAADWVTTLAGCTLSPDDLAGPERAASSAHRLRTRRRRLGRRPAADYPGRRLPDAQAVRRDLAHQPGEPDERPRRRSARRGHDRGTDAAAPPRRRSGRRRAAPDVRRPRRGWSLAAPARGRAGPPAPRPRGSGAADEGRLTTIGPLTERDETDPERGHGGEIEPPPPYQSRITDEPSPVQVLLDDPEADHRVTRRLDALVGQDLSADPQLQLIVDAHAMRRYYERPEQPQQVPRQEPDPDAPPTPRPDRPEHDFHARVGSFGATPALLRRLGLAIDVVLDGVDAAGARAALAGANWVSVTVTSPAADLEVLPPRRTAVVVDGDVFAARSSSAWVGGALPLGDDEWVVLDVDPDASGLKLDQHLRNLVRQYASEANGDPATSAPGTLRSTGFALARRDRAAQLRGRVQEAEKLAADDGTRELLLDDLVRGIRVEVWDDATKEWHSLHRRRVTVTGEGNPRVSVLEDEPDVGFLQLSALNRPPGEPDEGLLPARGRRRLGRLEPVRAAARTDDRARRAAGPGRRHRGGRRHAARRADRGRAHDGAGRAVVVAAAAVRHVVQLPGARRWTWRATRCRRCRPVAGARSRPTVRPSTTARTHLERLAIAVHRARPRGRCRGATRGRDRAPADAGARRCPAARRAALRRRAHRRDARRPGRPGGRRAARRDRVAQRAFDDVAAASRILAESRETLRVRPQLRIDADEFAELTRNDDLLLPDELRRPARVDRHDSAPVPAVGAGPSAGARRPARARHGGAAGRSGGAQRHSRRHRSRHPADRPNGTSRRPRRRSWRPRPPARFDKAIGTGDAAEIQRLYAVALAERGTLLDQFVPSLTDPLTRQASSTGSPSSTDPERTPARSTGRRWRRSRPIAAGRSARASTSCTTPTHCGCRTCPTRTPRRLAGVLRGGRAARAARAACAAGGHRAVPGRVARAAAVASRRRGGKRARRPSRRTRGLRDRCHRASRCGWRCRAPLTRVRSTTSGCGARTWRASSIPPTATPPTRSSPPRR